MERSHVLGMVCGYFLSRFDDRAYESLGFGSQRATHEALGSALGVPSGSIRNWRDEFDPVHENARQGWHKREMYPSRRRTIEALCDLSESELLVLVKAITESPCGQSAAELERVLGESDIEEGDESRTFNLRGPTGERAERAFMRHHAEHAEPIRGTLVDRRFDQCGFDFEIVGGSDRAFVEVKGLAGPSGGVTFTEKEWATAREKGNAYFLALVRNVASTPEFVIIRDPGANLVARPRTFTVVKVDWSVSPSTLHVAAASATAASRRTPSGGAIERPV